MCEFLELQQVTKLFPEGAVAALNNINFKVPQGAIVAVIGENGAGKSTLLRVIAGLEDVSAGRVLLEQAIVKGPSEQLVGGHPQIKLLMQDHKLRANRTVYENLFYELRAYRLGEANERIEEVLELCNAANLKDKQAWELSGGERQRSALAVALASSPKVILLDEPFSNFDAIRKRNFKSELFKLLRASKTTILFSTHENSEALAFADMVVVLKKGELIQYAEPVVVYTAPADLYTMQLIGSCSPLPSDLFPSRSHVGKPFIRAENIQLCSSKDAIFTATVVSSYYHGSHYEVTVHIGGLRITLYAESQQEVGARIDLYFDRNRVQFF